MHNNDDTGNRKSLGRVCYVEPITIITWPIFLALFFSAEVDKSFSDYELNVVYVSMHNCGV